MEVFLRSKGPIEEVAEIVRQCINVAHTNVTDYQRDQKRDSANHGGTYFLFEVFGLTLTLLRNAGDVVIPERSAFEYYVVVDSQLDAESTVLLTMCEHLAHLARNAGLDAAVGDLS